MVEPTSRYHSTLKVSKLPCKTGMLYSSKNSDPAPKLKLTRRITKPTLMKESMNMFTALDRVSSGLLYAFSNAVILRKMVLEMKLTKTMAKGTTMTRAFDSKYF